MHQPGPDWVGWGCKSLSICTKPYLLGRSIRFVSFWEIWSIQNKKNQQDHRKNKSNKGNAKVFENSDGVLPRRRDGKSITYTEHDYNTPPTPAQRANGADRGKRRVVIGSDNRVYYTNDHYRSFERFK
ncbi:hypothetical protein GO497_22920 [Acidovorax citrulli]|nr:hypothetical protein [Paracidovorax citrulli]